ncbi:fasciclin domain-containing protein [Pedobacter glucosidilyticus]|uniref:fasciclin domain-containing protein n=1 Tax=Pedobacter glucosidilyticus TaxID=1122941 RepID=UPI000404E4A1|nr:fasciclin domain-containing protein [Pedobacter glucosidilyticus]
MNLKRIFVIGVACLVTVLTACEKLPLQKSKKYTTSFYNDKLNMTTMEFIQSRPDLFSGLIEALAYVDQDPAFSDVKQLYMSEGNTFFLLHNNATINIEDGNSYFSINRVIDTDPSSPTFNLLVRGSSWADYSREEIARLLRYHVIKGRVDYPVLGSTPRWFESFAFNATNDSAKVRMYMTNDRDGNLRINDYLNSPVSGLTPRTPNLYATNGVVHVMNRFLTQPTRQAIINNP